VLFHGDHLPLSLQAEALVEQAGRVPDESRRTNGGAGVSKAKRRCKRLVDMHHHRPKWTTASAYPLADLSAVHTGPTKREQSTKSLVNSCLCSRRGHPTRTARHYVPPPPWKRLGGADDIEGGGLCRPRPRVGAMDSPGTCVAHDGHGNTRDRKEPTHRRRGTGETRNVPNTQNRHRGTGQGASSQ